MFIKVEALVDIKEGQLPYGVNPVRFLVEKIDSLNDGIIKTVLIEATVPNERYVIIWRSNK